MEMYSNTERDPILQYLYMYVDAIGRLYAKILHKIYTVYKSFCKKKLIAKKKRS